MEEIFSRFKGDLSIRQTLLERLADLRQKVAFLDANEPEDMDSEEHEHWGNTHEELEDRIDEILDLLDEL